ncbi:MAG: hypothetical protein ACE5HE_03940, partial [Phycisphaerae bacterium]
MHTARLGVRRFDFMRSAGVPLFTTVYLSALGQRCSDVKNLRRDSFMVTCSVRSAKRQPQKPTHTIASAGYGYTWRANPCDNAVG